MIVIFMHLIKKANVVTDCYRPHPRPGYVFLFGGMMWIVVCTKLVCVLVICFELLSLPRCCRRETLYAVRRALTPYGGRPVVVQPNGAKDRLAALANLEDVVHTQMNIAESLCKLTITSRGVCKQLVAYSWSYSPVFVSWQ